MNRRSDGALVGRVNAVDCYVSPFCPQDAAPFKWECVLGRGDTNPQLRAKGSAQTEEEAVKKAFWFAEVLSRLPQCPV